ncbi:MAG: CAP domain-containing protein [Actinomycetota bacterium]
MKHSSKWLKAAALFLGLVAVMITLAPPLAAAPARSDVEVADESAFVNATNAARAAAGMGPLAQGSWMDAARDHSDQMAASASIFHDSNLLAEAAAADSCWQTAGENVGRGGSSDAIQAALMASPTHRANVLGDFDTVSIGVRRTSDTIYVTERFMKFRADCGSRAGSTQLTLATSKPPAPAPAPPVARATPKAAPVQAPPAAAPTLSAPEGEKVLGNQASNRCDMYWCWFRAPAPGF